VPATYSEIDRAEKRGAIHRNAAARYKSRLAKAAAKKS
jgi:ribosomal protein S20